jgi:hypothetical protein
MERVLYGKDLNVMIGQYSGLDIGEIYIWIPKPEEIKPSLGIMLDDLMRSLDHSRHMALRYDECSKVYVNDALAWECSMKDQNYLGHGRVKIHVQDMPRQRVAFIARSIGMEVR